MLKVVVIGRSVVRPAPGHEDGVQGREKNVTKPWRAFTRSARIEFLD